MATELQAYDAGYAVAAAGGEMAPPSELAGDDLVAWVMGFEAYSIERALVA